jgi:hypothetical protein
MTARTEPDLLRAEYQRLQEFLLSAIGHFRRGEDAAGLENFLYALDKLEYVVEADQNTSQPGIDLDRLLPAVRGLYFYMRNQDITGIADLLEDTVYPLTQEWLEGCGGT